MKLLFAALVTLLVLVLSMIMLPASGEVGFEPTNAGSKVRSLAAWRLPNNFYQYIRTLMPEKE